MRKALGAAVLAGLLVACHSRIAHASGLVLADPRIDTAWGRQLGQPIAPNVVQRPDFELPSDLTGKARNSAYLEAMRGSQPTLDEAAAYHWYAPPESILIPPDRVPFAPVTAVEAAGYADALKAKMREAEPVLTTELDARFAALTAAVERADTITLPPAGAARITYCRWIIDVSVARSLPLAADLRKQCIVDRNKFIDALVLRLADLAVIPDLPDPDAAPVTDGRNSVVRSDLGLPPMVLPGETAIDAPLPYAPLAAKFDQRLTARFEAARPRLEARLAEALDRRDSSAVILPPSYECYALLGPYAGPLAQLPAAAGTADALAHVCLTVMGRQVQVKIDRIQREVVASLEAEAVRVRDGAPGSDRLEHMPEVACAATLAPHFPAPPAPRYDGGPWRFSGLDEVQSAALRKACVDAGAEVLRGVMDKRFARALADSVPDPDTLGGWVAHGWYGAAPGGTDWIAPKDNILSTSSLRQKFQADYEVTMEPRRKAAAARFVAEIERSFAVETGIVPEGAALLCSGNYKPGSSDLARTLFGSLIVAGPLPAADALNAKPGLTAQEADAWIRTTCGDLYARTLTRRRTLAREAGHAGDVFPSGLKLAVASPSGALVTVDPAHLVDSAAIDGLQVAFAPAGWLSGAAMTITPFGHPTPVMSGRLVETTRNDGQPFLKVEDLRGFRDLDGPLATVACVAMQVEQAHRQGSMRIVGAGAAVFFGDSFILAGEVQDVARQDLIVVEDCASAKRAFLQGEAGQ
jgi:hypothetical protein